MTPIVVRGGEGGDPVIVIWQRHVAPVVFTHFGYFAA